MKIPLWRYPFLYLSGTDIKTVSKCSSYILTKYSILGGLVCIPAVIGFCSSYFAISLIFRNEFIAPIVASIWAVTILTIDRCIVASNPSISSDKTYSQLTYGTRFGFSIILGIVIAEPLCVGIFSDVISEQISEDTLSEKKIKSKNYSSK